VDLEHRILARYDVKPADPAFEITPGTYRIWAAHHARDEAIWHDVVINDARTIAL
jgi:beta-glucosidase